MENIPSPESTLQTILTMFNFQGLDLTDLVALLGIYTTLVQDINVVEFKGVLKQLWFYGRN